MLRNNFSQGGEDLYTENYKTVMKEIKEDKINGKVSHIHGLEELILLKCPYYPKRSTDTMQSLLKIPMAFFTEIEKTILKFIWNHKRPPNSHNNLEEEKQTWRLYTPQFQTILQSYSNQN